MTRRGDATAPAGVAAEGEESRGGGNRRRLRANRAALLSNWEQEMIGFTITLMGCEPGPAFHDFLNCSPGNSLVVP
jgi:hypothetical protein